MLGRGDKENSMLLALLLFEPQGSHIAIPKCFWWKSVMEKTRGENDMFVLFWYLNSGVLHEVFVNSLWYFDETM